MLKENNKESVDPLEIISELRSDNVQLTRSFGVTDWTLARNKTDCYSVIDRRKRHGKSILVTGAVRLVGAIGRTVTKPLLYEGDAVRAMVRRSRAALSPGLLSPHVDCYALLVTLMVISRFSAVLITYDSLQCEAFNGDSAATTIVVTEMLAEAM